MSFVSVICILGLMAIAIRRRERGLGTVYGWIVAVSFIILLPTLLGLTSSPRNPHPIQLPVSPKVDLIGLDIENADTITAGWNVQGNVLHLQAYWNVHARLDETVFRWRLIDLQKQILAEYALPPRFDTSSTTAWIPNQIVQDHYALPINSNIPTGHYTLQVAYDQEYIDVGTINLTRTRTPAEPRPAFPITAQVGNSYHVLGYTGDTSAQPGEQYSFVTYWQTDRIDFKERIPFAQLVNAKGDSVAQHDSFLGMSFKPTSLWMPMVTVPVRHMLALPPALKPGIYALVTGLYSQADSSRLPVIAEQLAPLDDTVWLGDVRVPMNAQNAQPVKPVNLTLGTAIRLLGYDLHTSREEVKVKLYWQARTKNNEDYKVFVHLMDALGQVVAQVDQMPGEGLYPTRIWEPGEKIIDAHSLALKNLIAGEYRVVVGMYEPTSGERLEIIDANGKELPNRQIILASFPLP